MRLVTFSTGRRTGAGLLTNSNVIDIGLAFFDAFRRPYRYPDVAAFLDSDGPERLVDLDLGQFKGNPKVEHPGDGVALFAPIPRPPKIICVGLNYHSHAEEQGREAPEEPLFFLKAPNAVIGPHVPVPLHADLTSKLDYEVELGIVIGSAGYRIPEDEAEEYIFGYTIMNDISARDLQKSERQWFRAKSLWGSAPMGPMIISRDQFELEDTRIRMKINGNTRQDATLNDLIFKPAELVARISRIIPLEIGDIISTGTPGGVGAYQDPPDFLQDGDLMEAEIEGIGRLVNPVSAE